MTANEYIALYHETDSTKFYDEIRPKLFNGEYDMNGTWYPCIILDDDVGEGRTHIITRNHTFMTEPNEKVRRTVTNPART